MAWTSGDHREREVDVVRAVGGGNRAGVGDQMRPNRSVSTGQCLFIVNTTRLDVALVTRRARATCANNDASEQLPWVPSASTSRRAGSVGVGRGEDGGHDVRPWRPRASDVAVPSESTVRRAEPQPPAEQSLPLNRCRCSTLVRVMVYFTVSGVSESARRGDGPLSRRGCRRWW